MTLVLVLKVREGLVLAADSRRNSKPPRNDAAKILSFNETNHRHVGALASGDVVIDKSDVRTPYELLLELEEKGETPINRLQIEQYAGWFKDRFGSHHEAELGKKKEVRSTSTTLLVAGLNENEEEGQVWSVNFHCFAGNFTPLQSPVLMAGETDRMVARGTLKAPAGKNLSAFQMAYKSYFSEHKELIREIEDPDSWLGPWKLPDHTSLKDAARGAYVLIQRTISHRRCRREPTQIHDPIHVCTITRRDGLKKWFLTDAEKKELEEEDERIRMTRGVGQTSHQINRSWHLSQKLARDQIIQFITAEGKILFDELNNATFDYEKHFDANKIDLFMKRAGLPPALDVPTTLVNLP
jgi:hypothetical protein